MTSKASEGGIARLVVCAVENLGGGYLESDDQDDTPNRITITT